MTEHVNPGPWTDEEGTLFDEVGHVGVQDQYDGMSFSAGLFGWLTTVAVALLLHNLIGAVAVAAGASADVRDWDWDWLPDTAPGLLVAVTLLLVLLVAYYAGGYVAGRMCRFDGSRQGVAVWLTGLVVTAFVVALSLIMRPQLDFGDDVTLVGTLLSGVALTWAGAVAAVVALVSTLLAATAGGVVGHRYHDKVDRALSR